MVKDRKYIPQVPVMDVPFYPTNTTRTDKGSQQRTVGLYKEPEQPLVRGGDKEVGVGVCVEANTYVDSTPFFFRVLPLRWWKERWSSLAFSMEV